ncbi:MAG: methylated-DNA--[protein]-cysteine S-methyltransferase [Ignavibacteriales bacterium]|nr:methylated-DNA--[protein]-cysteine S-methyltransferase [Ignavibacteriales bacterium]
MEKVFYTSFNSKIGSIYVASTRKGVCKISIPGQSKKEFQSWVQNHFRGAEIVETATRNRRIIDELNRYLDRRLVKFHSRLHMVGSAFQKQVWRQIRKIRYGTTVSYKDLARRLGNPEAFRAVGRANATNPLPIVVPCHRVLGSRDEMVGYAAGIKTKEFLLRLEGAIML